MTTRLNIPEIGDTITLAEDWTFDLYPEYRNRSLFDVMGIPFVEPHYRRNPNPGPTKVTIPKGTKLKIDRIYIRKGASAFSSLSFLWPGMKTSKRTKTVTAVRVGMSNFSEVLSGLANASREQPAQPEELPFTYTIPARGVRFWAKLPDVRNMVIE